MKRFLSSLFIAALLFTSCKKYTDKPNFDELDLAELSVEFDNIVGGRTLSFNNAAVPYTNNKNEAYTISALKYFISNIKVTTQNGQQFAVKQDSSYFLIDASDRTTRFAKVKVPEGDYKSLEFLLGVDSLRSTAAIDKRAGVLDPAKTDMYWGWNSGYIFFKLEGNSSVITDDALGDPTGNKAFKYHIGGFGGYSSATINNIKTISIDLQNAGIAKVRKERKSNIHLFVDVAKVFDGSNSFTIRSHPNVMFSQFSVDIAKNLTEMFSHDHTEN